MAFMFIFLLLWAIGGKINGLIIMSETKLMNELMWNYNKNSHPAIHSNKTIQVELRIHLRRIISLRERENYLRTDIWLTQRWENELLVWDPKEHNGIKTLNMLRSELWVPDTYIYNDVANQTSKYFYDNTTYVLMRYDGMHETYFSLNAYTQCHMDVHSFPFDIQKCNITFGSWTNDITRINMYTTMNFSLIYYKSSPAWKLLSGYMINYALTYPCCEHPFSIVTMQIKIQRQSIIHAAVLLFPCLMFCLPMLISFMSPPECGERISCSVLVLLALIFYIEVSNKHLPKSSLQIPVTVKLYISLMILSTLSTLATSFVTKMFYSRHYDLYTEFNEVQKTLLRIGMKIPLIGVKCKRILKLKNELIDSRQPTKTQCITCQDITPSALENTSQILSTIWDETFEERCCTSKSTSLFDRSNPSTILNVRINNSNAKLKQLQSILSELRLTKKTLKENESSEKKENYQKDFASLIVDLMDRLLLLLFIAALLSIYLFTLHPVMHLR